MIDFSCYNYTKRAVYVKNVLSLNEPELDYQAIRGMEIKKGDRGSGIYGIFNMQTKGLYVGSTTNYHKRTVGHLNTIRTGKSYASIHSDFEKTGADAFVFIKIHNVLPEELIDAENFWMKSLSATYNVNAARELNISIEAKRKGRKNGIVTIGHYSAAVIKKSLNGEFIKEYNSLKAAAIEHGGKHLSYLISKNCRSKTKEALGGIWEYKNGLSPAKPKWIKSAIQQPVIQINATTGDFIKIWDSSIEAGDYYGLQPHSIRRVAKSNKVAGGFLWRFANIKTFKP